MMVKVTNTHGDELDFESAVAFMDDGVREQVHGEIAPCTEQAFFDAYCKAHAERFGEEWFLAEPNPTW